MFPTFTKFYKQAAALYKRFSDWWVAQCDSESELPDFKSFGYNGTTGDYTGMPTD